jgi:hypothetical protein
MEIVVANADITQFAADLVVMKHADGFYSSARDHNRRIEHLALTIHGPGYGLDIE